MIRERGVGVVASLSRYRCGAWPRYLGYGRHDTHSSQRGPSGVGVSHEVQEEIVDDNIVACDDVRVCGAGGETMVEEVGGAGRGVAALC
jgi:hypothetical protein